MSLVRPYISKSSMETYNNCGNKYVISYSLGYREPPRKRTILGSAVHACMEAIAMVKMEIQNGLTEGTIKHDELGEIPWDKVSYELPSILSKDEIEKINKSRKNKQTYKSECMLKEGDIRYGRDWVNSLVETSWLHYSKNEEINFWNKPWEDNDRRELYNFVWMSIEQFNPANHNIKGIELVFDLPIEDELCRLDNGEYIRMKGFIDLLIEISPDVYLVLDWKTGQRSDLFSGKEKGLSDFSTDVQLCMYRYAVKKLFPNVKTVLVTIVYTRDGGQFSPEEPSNHDSYIFNVVKDHIQELKTCTEPKVFSEDREDFRCKHICYFAKKRTFDENKCDCQFIKEKIRSEGLEYTTAMYHKDNYGN